MEAMADLVLIGGDPALDLVNTAQRGIPLPGTANADFIQAPSDLITWSTRVGLLSDDEAERVGREWRRRPKDGDATVRAVRTIRESLYQVLLAMLGEPRPSDGALRTPTDVLHRHWVDAVRHSELDPSRTHVADRLRVGVDPDRAIVDRIAVAAVDIVRTVDTQRLRQCPVEAGGCGWVFLDQSRNGSRRWCRMADCGTQVKSRRLTERRREQRQ